MTGQRRNFKERKDCLNEYSDFESLKRFRLDSGGINFIIELIGHEIRAGSLKNPALTSIKKICLTPRFLATGNMQLCNGDDMGISQSSVSKAITCTLNGGGKPEKTTDLRQGTGPVTVFGFTSSLQFISNPECPKSVRKRIAEVINEYNNYDLNYHVLYNYINTEENIPPCFSYPRIFKKSRKSNINDYVCGSLRRDPKLNDLAICQWFYVMNTDANRLPNNVIEANCCHAKNTRCRKKRGCQPFKLPYPVVRRNSEKSEWQTTIEHIAVACVCGRTKKKKRKKPKRQKTRMCSTYYRQKITNSIIKYNKFVDHDNPYFYPNVRLNYKTAQCLNNSKHFSHNISRIKITLPRQFRRNMSYSIFCREYYVQTYDEQRIPNIMTEVVCKRSGKLLRRKRHKGFKCVQLKINFPVLRKNPADTKYEPTVERISVGCVCKQHRRYW